MTQTPTDALRLAPRRAVYDWLRDDVPLNVKMTVMPHHIDALMDRLSKAAPASPLSGGGMRAERIAELPDFLIALFDEWGEEDHAEAAKQIVTFLTDSEGLERYRESYGLPAAPTGEQK